MTQENPASTRKPRVLSGIQPTADSFHLGNYLGAVRNWVSLQETHECFYFIPDMHAITVAYDPKVLKQRTFIATAQLLALGVNLDESIIFPQSAVPEHAMLAWILNCQTGFGEASRMTQFKDKSSKQERTSVGLFTYPILQAADILLYQANAVPVGEDQRQHLELTRDLAIRMNNTYKRVFTVPEPHILKETATIKDLGDPERKMSKSNSTKNGLIELRDEPARIRKKIRSAVTDTGSEVTYDPENKPGVSNLLVIYSALADKSLQQLEADYAGKGYGDLKKDLGEVVADFCEPIAKSTQEYLSDQAELQRVLDSGAQRAREVASTTLARVYDRVGFFPPVSLPGDNKS
ncbi:tryptophan--tRNA ligase [Natronoglycomyces albus]|uniref:Tryptophan--tRNA ligase n=1 Tax=Natronoglycomyces albus TaxID=2811108 RepID=A0A895XRL5_9ACTN|nr:tryptophan--tRNA ligase [Natronoglycomyces albus]QSB05825.1 tryptophan--tRNA ligase [Natronoglycomyces albus]